MKEKLRVRLHGAFEVENFGDILLAKIFANWVQEAGGIPVGTSVPAYLQSELDLATSTKADVAGVIMIGGGYLGEPPRSLVGRWFWGEKLRHRHLAVMRAAKQAGLPYCITGVGFGPITNLLARREAVQLMSNATSVTFRDNESMDYASKYGFGQGSLSADAALSLRDLPLSLQATQERDRIAPKDGRRLVLVQLDRSLLTREGQFLERQLSRQLARDDLKVVGISDQRGTEVSNGHKVCFEKVQSKLRDAEFLPYDGVEKLIGRISAADLVITSKLHLGIVATALGKRVISFPTHSKTQRFYRQIGRENICLPLLQCTDQKVDDLLAHGLGLIGSPPERFPENILELSRENANQIRGFMRRIILDTRGR
ncbi:hypothetical protein CXZ10_09870 [Pleomorphomonas diazotrophica]|uniref:Polysaccharide pyruvyl transferase domain-containing protein n=1 Tax=Pleomorphomonas diazotrophica TaxID=1166257 RepID=A0A1I4VKD2_9HYPH|nr:polysaccharide pyruvyl transferase family protein [Pleomorphomonas diazotrophica]PKR89658.1 hypothetical protein CXZ10_09870 [Pleomorphomonas diazotrophica]SFN01599.1 Polysaccharide pyruvyl transferase [Pleomorphomonas diazotrophica]